LPAPEKPAPPVVKRVLDVQVEAERDGRVEPVDAEHPFHTKDGFHFKVTVHEPCYLSVLALNDAKDVTRLYPRDGDIDGPVEANRTRLLPGAQDQEASFFIEHDSSVERLVVVATTHSAGQCDTKRLFERTWKDPARPASWPLQPRITDVTAAESDEEGRNAGRRKRQRCDYAVLGAAFLELPHTPAP
jgi:hypothetical protein